MPPLKKKDTYKAGFAQVGLAGEMKSEQIVPQRVGSELHELHLALRPETGIAVFDLFHGQAGLRQQRGGIESGRADERASLARHDAGGERWRRAPAA